MNDESQKQVEKDLTHDIDMLYKKDFTEKELKEYLDKGQITPSDKIKSPQEILWVGDCTIATFGNFSASTGKAKSKKTFNVSALVAAAIKNGTVLKYRASLPADKRKIFYFDTEQSKYHCHNVLERILKLAGLPKEKDNNMITFIGLREYTPSLRVSIIDYALRNSKGYGLVIIDGIRDLMYDINNAKEATDIMTMLMAWTSKYNLHIHCVLHLNKNDNNARGHIGTELENKAETVLLISKSLRKKDVTEVKPMYMRDKEFTSFAFHINEDSIPVLEEDYKIRSGQKTLKTVTLQSLPLEIHKHVLDSLFKNSKPETYTEMVEKLRNEYEQMGYKKGVNAIKKILSEFTLKAIISKTDYGYEYNPEYISEKNKNN